MQQFLSELPALIMALAVIVMVTLFYLIGHASIADIIALASPVIVFWFEGAAFKWQPPTPTQPPTTPLQGGAVAQQEKQP
jgi:hypothetical protein